MPTLLFKGAGWFLDQVTVREYEFSPVEWIFPCHMWLDDHVGDCKTIRRLSVLGSCDVNGHSELERLNSAENRENDVLGKQSELCTAFDRRARAFE